MNIWQTARFTLDLNYPKIMGIVNLTPDSFSDGGVYSHTICDSLNHAEQLLRDGADILDIGGESTRPNAKIVPLEEEWQRVAPILAEVSRWQVPISLDTRHTLIMQRAIDLGYIDIINDVQALENKGAVKTVAQSSVGVCLMHMRGLPATMQHDVHYHDVVQEVCHYLQQRVDVCIQAGIKPERITLDVGFGFGKNLQHNITLMQHLAQLRSSYQLPLLVGVSRKRMIGELAQRDNPQDRVAGSVAAALFAIQQGAKIIRVHDVRETVDAMRVWLGLTTDS